MNGFFSVSFVSQLAVLVFTAGAFVAVVKAQMATLNDRQKRFEQELHDLREGQEKNTIELAVLRARLGMRDSGKE